MLTASAVAEIAGGITPISSHCFVTDELAIYRFNSRYTTQCTGRYHGFRCIFCLNSLPISLFGNIAIQVHLGDEPVCIILWISNITEKISNVCVWNPHRIIQLFAAQLFSMYNLLYNARTLNYAQIMCLYSSYGSYKNRRSISPLNSIIWLIFVTET